MRKLKHRGKLLPSWNMPSDPVKAVFWFIHWLLKVLVRFFWILILVGVVYESFLNGIVGGIGILLVGLGVWLGLAVALFIFNIGSGVSQTVQEVSRMQRGFPPRRPIYPFTEPDDGKIVEGTITDLEEERKKRRRE